MSNTPAFDPLLNTLASSSQQTVAPIRQSAPQQVQPVLSQPSVVQQRQQPIQPQQEQPVTVTVQKQPIAPTVPPKRIQQQKQQQQNQLSHQQSHLQQEEPHFIQQQQQHPNPVSEVTVQPTQQRQQLQTVQAQQPLRDSNFRLRSPPKEYYHQQERVSKQQPPIEAAHQQQQQANWCEQLDQLLEPVEQQLSFRSEVTKPSQQQEKQPPPHSLQATYQPPKPTQSHQQEAEQFRPQQYPHQAEKQPTHHQKSKAEVNVIVIF